MYHETFADFKIQEPTVKRPLPSNIGLRHKDIIVIKNNIEKKTPKQTYLPSVEIVANVFHMYIVSSLTQHLNITKKNNTVTSPEPLNNS